jgi:hypothetical protein
MLQNGIPTKIMAEYFKNHLAASIIKSPQNIRDFIKTSLLLTKYLSPIRATLIDCGYTTNFFSPSTHGQVFSIYLDDEQTLNAVTSFWNERYIHLSNTILLPSSLFVRNVKTVLSVLLEAVEPRVIYVFTQRKAVQIQRLYDRICNTIKELKKEMNVVISSDLSAYDALPKTLVFSQSTTLTQAIQSNGSVRFHPVIPTGHNNKECLFGVTAKVQFDTGMRMALPSTLTSSLLLSNEIERIKNARENLHQLGAHWLNPRYMRATHNGITGLATSNREARFFNHSHETIITEHVMQAGIEVKANKYTRYAQGIVRRLGGIAKALRILDSDTLILVRAITATRAEQSGLLFDQIVEYLRISEVKNPKEVTESKLTALLEQGMIRTGVAITCKSCDLKDWYHLENIGGDIICNGCGERITLSLQGERFSYKANELLRRFTDTGGQAIFDTASILYRLDITGSIHFGGDLFKKGERTNFAEVDLFWLTNNVFGIVECKSYKNIPKETINNFRDTLVNLIDNVAGEIGVHMIIFSIYFSEACDVGLYKLAGQMSKRAKQKGLALHLIVNNRFHKWGQTEGCDPKDVRVSDLFDKKERRKRPRKIGDEPNQWSFGGMLNAVDDKTSETWLNRQKKDIA